MSTSETGDEPNFLARMLAKAQRQQPATSGDMDLRPAPMDDVGSSSEERSWWWKKPSMKLTAFDLLYGLQAQEAAIGTTPSEVEVEVIGMAFQQTAARLEAMGEVDKAEVHAHTGQCMETACTSLNPCYTACHVCACALHVHCIHGAFALHMQDVLHVLLPSFLQRTAAAVLQAGGRDGDSPVALPAGRFAARTGTEEAAPAVQGRDQRWPPDASVRVD
jgi:hypothetical protein